MMPPLLFVCRRLVDAHWPQITALAEALLANGIVKRKEMLRLLGHRTTPPRDVVLMIAWLVMRARLASPTIPMRREASSAA